MNDKAGSGQWSVSLDFFFRSCQEHLLEPANISPQKSWRTKDLFELLLLELLARSYFMIEFVFIRRIFAVMSHSGLKAGFCFQMPFALKGDVALSICQVSGKKNKSKNHQAAHSSQETLETSIVLCFRKIKTKQCLVNALLVPIWGQLDLYNSRVSDCDSPARNKDGGCLLVC